MATVDFAIDVAQVEDVKRIKVLKGKSFSLALRRATDDDYKGDIDNAATGDPVLDVETDADLPEVVAILAKNVGVSRFFFIKKATAGIEVIREVRIEIVASFQDPAVSLGATGELIDKSVI